MKKLKALLVAGILGVCTMTMSGCVTNAEPVVDPGMLHWGDSYYAASTTGQVWSAPADDNLRDGWHVIGSLLASTPGWATPGQGYWAPQIYWYPAISKFVAYYAAMNKNTGRRCIGYATSDSVINFTDQGSPMCGGGDYSVIGASVFHDPTNGQYWMTYKDDIPAGQGTKRIMVRPVASNGRPTGSPTTILTPSQPWETNQWSSVEGPSIVYHRGDTPGDDYYLFYAGNLYSTDRYGIGVARANSPTGPYTKRAVPSNPILSGNYAGSDFCGVGTADLTDDGNAIWYSTFRSQSGEACTGQRYLAVEQVTWSNGWPNINNGKPSG
jgi:arabinan endo-1,5-alpha-L-arabinosidase